jgi:F-type H+-transporting ATPase subunit b
MKIDWFTVIAQAINFLILVWLLKRYLYKPILNAIDQREQKIKSQLEEAAANKAEAQKAQDQYKQKNEEFDEQKSIMMNQAIAEVDDEREKLLEQARKDADTKRSALEKSLKDLQKETIQEIGKRIQSEVLSIARKTLDDLASASLEDQIANTFIKRIGELKDAEKERFISSFKSASTPLIIRSAFGLSTESQAKIQKAINDALKTTAQFQFDEKPELIGGIELVTNGYKLSWSISEYLTSLQNSISEITQGMSREEPEKRENANR